MANETVATEAPKKIGSAAFFYPVEREFTGLVQFRIGAGAEIDAPPSGKWLEGEVKPIKSPDFAARLIAGGLHAHVAAGTPLGQPAELRPKQETAAPPQPPPAPSSKPSRREPADAPGASKE